MRLMGVSGLASSGKDTFSDFLVKDHGWTKIALADPIKRAAADWFGWDYDRLWGPSENRNMSDPNLGGLSARKALQLMGTEIGRQLYPDVWIDYALRTAKKILEGNNNGIYRVYDAQIGIDPVNAFVTTFWPPQGVVISDVRFLNEVEALKKAGAILVRLRRGQPLEGEAGLHRSETEMQEISDDLFDYVIDNRDLSLDELGRVAMYIVGGACPGDDAIQLIAKAIR